MKKINKLIIILSVLSIINSCKKEIITHDSNFSCSSTILNSHPESNRFDLFLKEKVRVGLPGISMLIETPDGIWTGAAGVADIPSQTPMKSCNVHRIGSITKVFTSVLIHKLKEDSLLKLDDKISKYLSQDITSKIGNGTTVTIKNLLSHTSGIPGYLDLPYTFKYYNNLRKHWTAMEELGLIYNKPPLYPAGTKTSYSNTNFLLLGLIAEHVTGKTGTQLYQEEIFNVLGLDNTYFNQKSIIPSQLVRGYYDEFGDGRVIDITDQTYAMNSMAGGMCSNVEDLYDFMKACITPNVLISSTSISEMMNPTRIPMLNKNAFGLGTGNKVKEIVGIGLGWFTIDTKYGEAIGHNGGFNGRRARLWHFPSSNKTIVFMINGSGGKITEISSKLFRNEMIELLFE